MQLGLLRITLLDVATAHVGTQTIAQPDRAALIAELESLPVEPAAEEVQAAPESAETSPAADPAAEPADEAPQAETPPEPADAETQRRLATVKKQEERLRQQLAKERADLQAEIQRERQAFQRERDEWAPKLEKFKQLQARAKYEPDAVIEELLGNDVDYEYASKRFFVKSKAAANDPKHAAEVRATQKEREIADMLAESRREIAELKQSLAAREEQQTHAQLQQQYLDDAVKAANDATPLLAQLITKNPAKAKNELWSTYVALYNELGEVPEPADVAAAYEKRRAAELADLGIDVATVTKRRAPAPATRPTTTLGAAPSATTPVPGKKSRAELEAEVIKELAAGNFSVE